MNDLKKDIRVKWVKEFISESTKRWKNKKINKDIFGWQIQPGTIWLAGYDEKKLNEIEEIIGCKLPTDVRIFLYATSGLSLPSINITKHIKQENKFMWDWHLNVEQIKDLYPEYNNDKVYDTIKKEGLFSDFKKENYSLIPIYGHRCIVCNKSDLTQSHIVSIYHDDVIIFADCLKNYLEREFLL